MDERINNIEKEIESLKNDFANLQSKNLIRSIGNSSQPVVVINNKQGDNRNENPIINNLNNNNENISEINKLNEQKFNNASGNTVEMMLGENNNKKNNMINISESNNIINDIPDKNLIKEEDDEFEFSKKSVKKEDKKKFDDDNEREARGNLPVPVEDKDINKKESVNEFSDFEEIED